MAKDILLMALWAFSCAAFFYYGRTRREDEVISSINSRIRRDEESLKQRKAAMKADRPRVRSVKIRPARRGLLGEEVEDDLQ